MGERGELLRLEVQRLLEVGPEEHHGPVVDGDLAVPLGAARGDALHLAEAERRPRPRGVDAAQDLERLFDVAAGEDGAL